MGSQGKTSAYQRNAASFMEIRDAARKLPAYDTLTNAAKLQLDDILRHTLGRGRRQSSIARAALGTNATVSRNTNILVKSGMIKRTLVTGEASTFSVVPLLRSIQAGADCEVPSRKRPKPSPLLIRKAPRIESVTLIQIAGGVELRSDDDRKEIITTLIRWHWENDAARPDENRIAEIASTVESTLGLQVRFSHLGVQRTCNSLSFIAPGKSGSGYAAMLSSVIRKHCHA